MVEPNPMVGCVLVREQTVGSVRDSVVIGEGFHEKFGGPHAEIQALVSCSHPANAVAYVTLEPCCHHGKTPPCTGALIEAGIRKVVVACSDPFNQVSGRGIAELKSAGIAVQTGVLESEARDLNAPYFKRVQTGVPWVIAKWAMSIDGKIASVSGSSRWISNTQSRQIVHQLRGRVDAIVIGVGTAIADDPLLTARPAGQRIARRVVFDTRARLPLESQLVKTAADYPVIVVVGPQAVSDRVEALEHAGCRVIASPADQRASLEYLLRILADEGCTNVLVEGGSQLLGAFNDARAIDEVHCFVGPIMLGGAGSVSPVAGAGFSSIDQSARLRDIQVRQIGNDSYIFGRLERQDL
jgi:diaminohydroxyphosphoribosylaminopyrimidine deaminase/5-amino-6-(5-phosphoribosylamino)uracil reductase